MLVFGGIGVDYLHEKDISANNIHEIKETLNDFWVYNFVENLWQTVFPNSL